MKNITKKLVCALLVLTMVIALSACGKSKDAVTGTWTGDMGLDGNITWTFDGKGGCTMKNEFMTQNGTYTLEDDQITIKLENWDNAKVYTFSVDGNSLTMNDNEGIAVSGTYTKK